MIAYAGLPQQVWPQNITATNEHEKQCFVPKEEIEVLTAHLKPGNAPQVLVTKTEYPYADVDDLNLQLAAKGRGIPPEVRTDFKEKNKSSCLIQPFTGIPGLHFISKQEEDLMFRVPSKGWSEFHKKYGKEADMLWVSRIGFNAEKTLALVHISGAIAGMAGGGTLYLLEFKDGKWVVKSQIATWTT